MKRDVLLLVSGGVLGISFLALGIISPIISFDELDWMLIPGILLLGLLISHLIVGKRFWSLTLPVRVDTVQDKLRELESDPRSSDQYLYPKLKRRLEEKSKRKYHEFHYYEEFVLKDIASDSGIKKWQQFFTLVGMVVVVTILTVAFQSAGLGRQVFLDQLLLLLLLVLVIFLLAVLSGFIILAHKKAVEDELKTLLVDRTALISFAAGGGFFLVLSAVGWINGWLDAAGFITGLILLVPFCLVAQLEGRFLMLFAFHQFYQLKNWDFLEGAMVWDPDEKGIKNRINGLVKRILAFIALLSIPAGFVGFLAGVLDVLTRTNVLAGGSTLESLFLLIPGPQALFVLIIGMGPLLTLLLKPFNYIQIWIHSGLYEKIGSDWSLDSLFYHVGKHEDIARLPPTTRNFQYNLSVMTVLVLVLVALSALSGMLPGRYLFLNAGTLIGSQIAGLVFLVNAILVLKNLDEEKALNILARESKKYGRDFINETLYGELCSVNEDSKASLEGLKRLKEFSPKDWGVPVYLIGVCSSRLIQESPPGSHERVKLHSELLLTLRRILDSNAILLPKMYWTVYNHLGASQMGEEDHEGALETFEKALKFPVSRNSGVFFGLGYLYSMKGELAKAENFFKRHLEDEPQDSTALTELAGVYAKKREYGKAERIFEKALDITPDKAHVYHGLGLMYKDRKLFDEAEKAFNKAIKLADGYESSYFHLGVLQAEQQRIQEAEETFRKAIQRFPTSTKNKEALATLFVRQERFAEAKEILGKIIEESSKNARAWFLLGKIHHLQKEGDSEELYRKALEIDPNNPDIWQHLGLFYESIEKYREAENSYETALSIDERHVGALYCLGILYQKLQRTEDAKESLKKATFYSSGLTGVWEELGKLYMNTGQLIAAKQAYRMAVQSYDKKSDSPWLELGNLYLDHQLYNEAETLFRE
ncbi:MAG: tetratricopeptide repeat protein, partial [Candidatus Odinarchaeota archaeon]